MRKCKCWQVKIFPQNSWFAQKLHSTILKIFWCFTKPDRPSSEAPAALPSGARDAWHDLSAIQLLSHSHWALCALQPSSSAHLPFSVPLKTSGRPNWATPSHAGWNIQCVTTSCVCQTGGVTVSCARQIFINSQDLLEDVGSLSEYSLSSDLRSFSFWGCEEQHFLTLCSSVQFLFVLFFFYFISLPYEGKHSGFPWSGFSHGFLCALMRFKIWGSLPNLWASAQASLCCTRGAILRICPISPV